MLSVSLGARAELVLQNGESDAQIELWLGKGVLEKDFLLATSVPRPSSKSSIRTGPVYGGQVRGRSTI